MFSSMCSHTCTGPCHTTEGKALNTLSTKPESSLGLFWSNAPDFYPYGFIFLFLDFLLTDSHSVRSFASDLFCLLSCSEVRPPRCLDWHPSPYSWVAHHGVAAAQFVVYIPWFDMWTAPGLDCFVRSWTSFSRDVYVHSSRGSEYPEGNCQVTGKMCLNRNHKEFPKVAVSLYAPHNTSVLLMGVKWCFLMALICMSTVAPCWVCFHARYSCTMLRSSAHSPPAVHTVLLSCRVLHTGRKSLASCVCCSYFLPVCGLPVPFLNAVFPWT